MPNAPAILFDAHAHFFTADTALYPIDVTGAREGEEAVRSRIARDPMDAARLLRLWAECSVTGGAAVQYNTIYKTDNRYTLDVADAHPERTGAVLMLKADSEETPDFLHSLARKHNVAGLRLFGYPDGDGAFPWLDSAATLKSWDMAADLGLAMVVMHGPARISSDALSHIAALARRYPSMPVALDHAAWACTDGDCVDGDALSVLDPIPNVFFKFTQINLDRLEDQGANAALFVRNLVDRFGAGRVMWGSDVGNTQAPYPAIVEHAIAATAMLTDAERQRVLHDNGHATFGPGRHS